MIATVSSIPSLQPHFEIQNKKPFTKYELVEDEPFFQAWKNYVWKKALSYARNRYPGYDAEDFFSLGMIGLASIKKENRWSSNYVIRVIHSRMTNVVLYHRRAKNDAILLHIDDTIDEEGMSTFEVEDPKSLNHIKALDTREQLDTLLTPLRGEERQLLDLVRNGYTYDEIASAWGLPVRRIQNLASIAIKRVRNPRKKYRKARTYESMPFPQPAPAAPIPV
jgi:RNA polymerase sigma factor (sigma-70 family)